MKYLLDTNVLSELKKPKPEKKVVEFVKKLSIEETHLSCISVGEIKYDMASCKDKNKAKELNFWFDKYLLTKMENQIVNIDAKIMCEWGEFSSKTKNLSILDGLIAATCIAYKFCLVTRNVKDFERIKELKILNPWE